MTRSLSLSMLLLSLHPSQASRSPESLVDQAPLAGSQMIQLRAKADEAVKTEWAVTYSNTKKTCHQSKIITWGARGVTNEEECQQACASWPVGQPKNKHSDKSCGAGYFFHKADGSPSCRLYETCDTCRRVGIAGFTFTSSATGCKAPCAREDCKRDDGFKPKSGWQEVMCSGSDCSPSECCVQCSTPHCEKEPTCRPKDCKKEDGFKPKSDWQDIMCVGSQCSPSECCDKEPEPSEPMEPKPTAPVEPDPEPVEPEPAESGSFKCYSNTDCISEAGYDHDLLRDWVGTEEECEAKCTELGCVGFIRTRENSKCYFRAGRIKMKTIGDALDRNCCVPKAAPSPYACYPETDCISEAGYDHDLLRDWVGTEEECEAKCTEIGCVGFIRTPENSKCYFRGGRIKMKTIGDAKDRNCCVPNAAPSPYVCYPETNCLSEAGYDHDLLRDWVGTEEECKAKCTEIGCVGFVRTPEDSECYFRADRIVMEATGDAPDRTCCVPQ